MKLRDKLYKKAIKEKVSQTKIKNMKLTKSIETKLNIYYKLVKKLIITNNLKKKNCKALWDDIHEIIYSKKKDIFSL